MPGGPALRLVLLCGLCASCGTGDRAEPARAPSAAEEPAHDSPNGSPGATGGDEGGRGDPDGEGAAGADAPPTLIAIDTHVDTPQRMTDDGDDLADRLEGGHLDIPRMREGGLTGAFFSIWVNPRHFAGDAAWERALALVEAVRRVAEAHPDRAALCTTAEEVRRAAGEGKVALLMGVEGGHALGSDEAEVVLERLRLIHALGARYMTITWSNDNPLGHSSGGDAPEEGLTDLGRRVVREMNRLGMIVDVSHVSDQTFWDIMEVTRRPVLASHSSARALSDHPRNMRDDMIRRVGRDGGAVCVNYFPQFIDVAYRGRRRRLEARHRARFEQLAEEHESYIERGRAQLALALELDPDLRPPTLETLGAHFAHVVSIAGPGGACLGSDFDGVPELPIGMDDVSDLPALRAELERRGLPVGPILGENVLRVLAAQTAP